MNKLVQVNIDDLLIAVDVLGEKLNKIILVDADALNMSREDILKAAEPIRTARRNIIRAINK